MDKRPDLTFTETCEYFKDTCDSFGRYVSTYCNKHHVHLNGFAGSNPNVCRRCPDYKQNIHTLKRP